MTPLIDLYVAQPFWIWLGVGVLLLAVEAAFSTEWLLWPALIEGSQPLAGETVIVESVSGPTLKVRAV